MPRLLNIDIDPVDVDADGIAASQTPSGAGDFTLDGALTSGGTYTSADGAARNVSFTSGSVETGDTYTITGTDADGNAQTEAVTGPNATTVYSTKYFLTVTQIATDGAATGAITIGVGEDLSSKTVVLNRHASTGALLHFDVTGTINVTVQVGGFRPADFANQGAMPWMDSQDTDLVGATANAIGNLDTHSTACRVLVNSFSSGAEVQAYISQGYK
jgi:hypothetical protein